ncbi:Inositol-pentakisphosphate 2-kinase [Neodidymelliopsis sp. IMI 364377]|nr:Inositol-pentakisphosphate 2-kinase [Neodidymelliopsis sp. IMI 364377]
MTLSSPVFDKFRNLLWPRKPEPSSSKPGTGVQKSFSDKVQPSSPSAEIRTSQLGNAHLQYQVGDDAPSRDSPADSAQPSQLSDLEILHTRLSNGHLLAHHQFELHPAGGVSYKPHLTGPARHGRQPSHSLVPHIQPDPLSSESLSDATTKSVSVDLKQNEKRAFQSLDIPSALCCVSRKDKDLQQYLICFNSLNEGAANAVFSVQSNHCSEEATGFLFVAVRDSGNTATAIPSQMVTDKVLRVSKGLPKSLRSEVIVDGFMADVRPLFVSPQASTSRSQTLEEIDLDKHLMAHLPVVLFDDAMSMLKAQIPAIRPLGSTAQFGILLPDMSTVVGQNITFEIKPKWLAQSPAAPPDAIRCRTCALQFSRGKGIPDDYICPLQLSNENLGENDGVAQIRRWAANCLALQLKHDENASSAKGISPEVLIDRVVAYFTSGDGRTLLLHLKKLQATLDSEGILQRHARPRDDFNFVYDLRLAMTLRDCSLFVVIPLLDGNVASKLADLDFKSAEKIDDWRDKEATLVDEGWYTKDPEMHNVCLLAYNKST